MSEHPLLFTSAMVKAVLDDRKTQTRRVPVERYRKWKVGDTIWVREAWCYAQLYGLYGYDAREDGGEIWYKATDAGMCEGPWKPSIHMFRKHARIFLKITGLRDERVQDISENDAESEGTNCDRTYREDFKKLWDSINAKRHNGIYAWSKNPVAKVIEFKKL